ncbi:MAG: FAD dependent oxidoreductase [uncultured Sulfurovum sp.]|uniref:FAD dependent oxidoreductase n=1 Tax=uncultured Sulfurovum sp. TaxID=269237 RepID=A0A6S6T3C8_9BACT|nr:MAG: FAD dependent oxidoreductase [uncultured Sulfurovum sp.]
MKYYDIIVVGAGIVGCSSAYFLKEKGLRVLVLDRDGIAKSGGSAAAGAFVSPKIGKGSSLQSLTNEAFEFSKEFYLKNFPEHFKQTGVIRIPKDEDDAKQFFEYEKYDASKREWLREEKLKNLGIKKSKDSFLFDEAGVCDAPEMCEAFLEGIDYVQYEVKSLSYEDEVWNIGGYNASKLILATGYENKFFDMRYMGVKGTWGRRGDYETKLDLVVSIHKKISVSANLEGIIKVGATHEKEVNSCVLCGAEPLKGLFSIASEMVDTSDFKLKKTFSGMRAGSKDYFPLVGSVIDVAEMLEKNPKLLRGAKLTAKPIRMENLYVCNGVGGRGFVFAPFIGKMLADNIVDGKEIDERVNPDRLFLKWCRRSPDLER